MLNAATPFLLTTVEMKKGGVLCIEYDLDTGTGYQSMYMEFDPNVQILDDSKMLALNDAMHSLCLHANHFVNNVPHRAILEQLEGMRYIFTQEAQDVIDEALGQQDTIEPKPFDGFPENYGYYERLESQLHVRKVSFSPLQSNVTIRVAKSTITPYSEFAGPPLQVDLCINLHSEFHGGGGAKALDYIFHEALSADLKPIQDLCQWFVDNAMTVQTRQMNLFQCGEYVNRNVPTDTGEGFNLTDNGEQPKSDFEHGTEQEKTPSRRKRQRPDEAVAA